MVDVSKVKSIKNFFEVTSSKMKLHFKKVSIIEFYKQ